MEFFSHGAQGLDAMCDAIAGARERVHLETYILRDDTTGLRFLEALEDRARAGVEVRLLYDALGSRGLANAALDPLRAAGGEVVAFNPLSWIWPALAPRRRDHRIRVTINCAVHAMLP